MKKALSIVLAVVMLFAVCVPAFAAELPEELKANGQSGTVIVKTTTKTADDKDARNFTVTIPADTEIPWGEPTKDLVYSVESHLGDQEYVNVKVTGNDKMIYNASEVYELPYTLTGDVDSTEIKPNVYPAAEHTVTVNVEDLTWKTAVVGDYADTLTFTAAIV